MKTLLFLPAVALISLSVSCGNSTENSKNDTANVQQTSGPTLEEKQQKATFIMDTQFDSMDIPRTTVSVEYNDARTALDPMICSPSVYDKQQMKEMECPDNTIMAIGGWFAGGGDYYYIVPTATGIAVYKGYLDEGDETPGYHWQKFKDID
jgi:hypothetical protein